MKKAIHTVDGSEILHQLRLVVHPMIYSVSYIPGGWPWDFNHQQKHENFLSASYGGLEHLIFITMVFKPPALDQVVSLFHLLKKKLQIATKKYC